MPLVTRTRYNAKGEPFETVDPKGIVTRTEFDALGRRVRTIQNYLPGSTDPDANITTEFTYKAGHLSAVTAVNAATGNQTTRYEYGVSPATGSMVSRNDLLRETIYPDGGLDTVKNRYNRQGERIGMTDQNGTVHAYERDKLGRLTADEVTSLGTGIDGAVRKLGTTYNARGLVEKLTSYGPTGSVVNEVKNTYNGLNQLTEQAQSHAGAVTGGTPKVEYGYDHSASGGVFTKGARPTDVTYPSGRVIDFDYGSAGGAGDKLARIEALVDGAQTLVSYSYLGVGTFVITDYVEPEAKLNYTAAASGDAKYPGFDQYNRVVQHHWTAYGASPGLRDGFDYGYDANSDRLWRANLTAQALDKPFDELYRYDRLNRLVDFQRGTLNAEHTAILDTPTKEQTWNLDPTGNWSQFTSAHEGVLETDQTRISNPANEITEISSWFPPGYDHAGNMTRIPKPAAPQEGFLATWDAWNRMVKLVDASTRDTVQENAFDAQIWRTVRKDYEAGSLSETRHFFYTVEWQDIEERLGAATTPERQYVWGLRYIDDLILRDRDTDDNGDLDERLYAMQDANWNVAATCSPIGYVAYRIVYHPYGKSLVISGTFTPLSSLLEDWDVRFTGRTEELSTKLHYYRNRYYSTQVGGFLTRDPMLFTGGSANLYSYGLASPLRYTDPFGFAACCGPEVTKWFTRQLPLIRKAREGFTIGFGAYKTLFRSLKFENAGLTTDGCPSAGCKDTVTLCGRCIDVTELGNIAYGFAADENRGTMLWGGFYAEVHGGRGFDKLLEVVSSLAGFQLRFVFDKATDKDIDICKLLSNPIKAIENIWMQASIAYNMQNLNWTHGWTQWWWNEEVLESWSDTYGGTLGTWDKFLAKAYERITKDSPLNIIAVNGCTPCAEKVDPGDLSVGDDGHVTWPK